MGRYAPRQRFLHWSLGLSAMAVSAVVAALLVMTVQDARRGEAAAEVEQDRERAELTAVIESLRGDVAALRAQLIAGGVEPVVAAPAPTPTPATRRPTPSTARPTTTSTTRPWSSPSTTTTSSSTTSTTQRPQQPVCTTLPVTEGCL